MPATVSASELRSKLETVLKDREPAVVALAIEAEFPGQTLECRGRTYQVRRARSVLEFHDLIDQAQGHPLLCLTSLADQELGLDLRCQLHKRRVLSVNPWETVQHMFDCQNIESSLIKDSHLASFLLTSQPPQGYSKVKGDVLTADKVWSCLFTHRLGMPSDYLDNFSVLEWASGDCSAYKDAPQELKTSAAARVLQICGEYGRAVLDTIEDGRLHPLALGLALRCLATERPNRDQEKALVRLEQYTGNQPLSPKVVNDWAEAAEHLYDSTPGAVQAAERILSDLQVASLAGLSHYLPTGLSSRLDALAKALEKALGSKKGTEALEAAVSSCLAHQSLSPEQRERLEMLPRLLRWCQTPESKSNGLKKLARRYAQNTSFAAWARLRCEGSFSHLELDRQVVQLGNRVVARLESEAAAFAQGLSAWNSAGEPGADVWKVEQLIDSVLVPIASTKGGRFLLVVLDGCGWPTMQELMNSFPSANWRSLEPESGGGIPPILATYPSVTECSRTSLLSGELTRGSASTETKNFRDHSALRAACNQGYPPILFHKGQLSGEFEGLASEVEERISNTKAKAVAVVLNAIDDHLDRDDQIHHHWTQSSIKYLTALCTLAHRAGRILVLASDHGHVLERGATLQKAEGAGGARWRTGATPAEGEVALTGPRVLIEEDTVTLPWTEMVRYTKKKNGYHGGCHPAELLTPLVVMAPAAIELPGWAEAYYAKPSWWFKKADSSVAASRPVQRSLPQAEPASGQLLLIDEPAGPEPDFAETVLNFPLIAAQMKRRKPAPDREWAKRLLGALWDRGDSAPVAQLAAEFGQPEARFRQVLGDVASVLAVDGRYLVSVTPDAQTVLLNRGVLFGSATPDSESTISANRDNGDTIRFEVPLKTLTAAEKIILTELAKYGQLSESELKKAQKTRRGGSVERLMEKLNKHGFPHITQIGEGQGGRLYRLNVEELNS